MDELIEFVVKEVRNSTLFDLEFGSTRYSSARHAIIKRAMNQVKGPFANTSVYNTLLGVINTVVM